MNIDRQEVLSTIANPYWKTDMYFQIIDAQAQILRFERHNRTLESIREYRRYCRQHGKKDMERIMANCERLYRTGYDL